MTARPNDHIKGLVRSHIYAGGERFTGLDSASIVHQKMQAALGIAKTRYGHALCECVKPPLRLQIKRFDGLYQLSCWPGEQLMHDSACRFYKPELHALTEFPNCIQQVPADSQANPGTIRLALTFSFGISANDVVAHKIATQRGDKAAQGINMRGLANILWEESGLTQWNPAWTRDWGTARHALLQTAKSVLVKEQPLYEAMFIPSPFRKERQQQLNAELDAFIDQLTKSSNGVMRSGLMIAPVRKLVRLQEGTTALHLRSMVPAIALTSGAADFLNSECENQLKAVKEVSEADDATAIKVRQEVVAFLHVRASPKRGLWCIGAWLMSVHPRIFVPTSSRWEVMLLEAMIKEGHQFNRSLSVERTARRNEFDWHVGHVIDPRGKPSFKTALDVISSDRGKNFLERREHLAKRMQAQGVPVWTWKHGASDTQADVPPLPPKTPLQPSQIAQRLTQIELTDKVSYMFGASGPSNTSSTQGQGT